MPWQLDAQFIEVCSCNVMCPCWLGVPELAIPDQGYCGTVYVFRIHQGSSDGVDLAGGIAVVCMDFPGNPFNGGGTARLYLDQSAPAAQRRELETIFTGGRGGPWAALAGALVARWLPTHATTIDLRDDGDCVVMTVNRVATLKSTLLRDANGRVTDLQTVGMAYALAASAFQLAPSAAQWRDPDIRHFDTRSGGRGALCWSG